MLTVRGIGMLFRGINLREAVTGPIGILDLIGTTAKSGFARGFGPGMLSTFELLAFLSVTLFLMNLLPLPALDGGQIVFSLAEMVRGRAVKPRMIWRVQLIGFSFMMVLFLVLTFNDISSGWDGRPWRTPPGGASRASARRRSRRICRP